MQIVLREIAEIIFTSYLLPALMLPLIWTAGALARRNRGTGVAQPDRSAPSRSTAARRWC